MADLPPGRGQQTGGKPPGGRQGIEGHYTGIGMLQAMDGGSMGAHQMQVMPAQSHMVHPSAAYPPSTTGVPRYAGQGRQVMPQGTGSMPYGAALQQAPAQAASPYMTSASRQAPAQPGMRVQAAGMARISPPAISQGHHMGHPSLTQQAQVPQQRMSQVLHQAGMVMAPSSSSAPTSAYAADQSSRLATTDPTGANRTWQQYPPLPPPSSYVTAAPPQHAYQQQPHPQGYVSAPPQQQQATAVVAPQHRYPPSAGQSAAHMQRVAPATYAPHPGHLQQQQQQQQPPQQQPASNAAQYGHRYQQQPPPQQQAPQQYARQQPPPPQVQHQIQPQQTPHRQQIRYPPVPQVQAQQIDPTYQLRLEMQAQQQQQQQQSLQQAQQQRQHQLQQQAQQQAQQQQQAQPQHLQHQHQQPLTLPSASSSSSLRGSSSSSLSSTPVPPQQPIASVRASQAAVPPASSSAAVVPPRQPSTRASAASSSVAAPSPAPAPAPAGSKHVEPIGLPVPPSKHEGRYPSLSPLASLSTELKQPGGGLGGGGGGLPTLVPIRLDVDVGGVRCLDSFTWDLHGSLVTPEQFAAQLCADLDMPQEFEWRIATSIHRQLQAYQHAAAALQPATTGGLLCPITLSMRTGACVYQDVVEWDVLNDHNSPEAFARRTVADQGLPPEFEPVIATTIREQVLSFRKVLRSGGRGAAEWGQVPFKEVVGAQDKEGGLLLRTVPQTIEQVVRREEEQAFWGPKISIPERREQTLYEADTLRLAKPLSSLVDKG